MKTNNHQRFNQKKKVPLRVEYVNHKKNAVYNASFHV